MRHRTTLAQDSAGTTAIEFALGVPVLLLAAVLLIEVGFWLSVQSVLNIGTREASRVGITGAPPPDGMTRDQQLRRIILDTSSGFIDPAQLATDLVSYGSFDDVGKPEPFVDLNGNKRWDPGEPFTDVNGNGRWDADRGAAGAGAGGQVVVYHVTYAGKPLTQMAASLLSEGAYRYETHIVVRNEPF